MHSCPSSHTPRSKKKADRSSDGVHDEHQAGTASDDPEGTESSRHSEDSNGLQDEEVIESSSVSSGETP